MKNKLIQITIFLFGLLLYTYLSISYKTNTENFFSPEALLSENKETITSIVFKQNKEVIVPRNQYDILYSKIGEFSETKLYGEKDSSKSICSAKIYRNDKTIDVILIRKSRPKSPFVAYFNTYSGNTTYYYKRYLAGNFCKEIPKSINFSLTTE